MQPQFPIYLPTKGRWDTRHTSKALTRMGVPHHLVIEDAEYDDYARNINPDLVTLLPLDPAFQRDYDTCDQLGHTKSPGPGPARNFAWAHALEHGHTHHWVMDDNITKFYRAHQNRQIPLGDGTGLRAMEDFALRYRNVAMSGPNYYAFAKRKQKIPPFVTNTRIYSCNLIRNNLPWRWRGRYNEDTDLSLRMLKAGWCTVQFNAFLQNKLATQTVQGGNTEAFYAREGTRPKSEMLAQLHPDVTRLVWRFGREHHYVNYHVFTQPLRPANRTPPPANYTMNIRTRV